MTPKEKALDIFGKMQMDFIYFASKEISKRNSLIAVNEIILANPHSNPFNTDVYSTMSYWQEVKQEIELL